MNDFAVPTIMPKVSLHRTSEDRLAALIDDQPMIALPARSGGFMIWFACRIEKPPADWTRSDFYSVGPHVDDEEGFCAYVREIAVHRCELRALQRIEIAPVAHTPWGGAQISRQYAEGIFFHATAGHGGFHLDAAANARVHDAYRNSSGWYEEDCEWSKVAAAFPDLFTAYERKCADRTLRDCAPDSYEKVTGITLRPGESRVKDQRQFRIDHADDWIVISAITARREPGVVECIATRGGDRSARNQCRFLVPSGEYDPGRFGFVIDETRHPIFDGPSHFGDGR